MSAENRAHTSHRIKKADTFVNRDEVVSKLRGTTRIESFSYCKQGLWMLYSSLASAMPRFLSVRLVTGATRGCLPLPGETVSTASSRVNFSDCSRARACSRWPFLSACAFPVRLLSLSLLFSTHYVRVECIKLWAKSLDEMCEISIYRHRLVPEIGEVCSDFI